MGWAHFFREPSSSSVRSFTQRVSWSSLFDTGSSIATIVIDPHNFNILYAGTSGGGVFRSIDSGANWSPFNDGLTNPDVRVLAIAPGSPNTLYAGIAGGVFGISLVP
jgi:hypothetical protein